MKTWLVVVISVCAACWGETASPRSGSIGQRLEPTRPPATVQAQVARLPLRFEENRGQLDARARYVARQGGMTLFLTEEGAVLSLRAQDAHPTRGPGATSASSAPATVVRLKVHDAARGARLEARTPLLTRSNYFLGNDPTRWRTGVPSFAEIVYRDVRPGVDLVFHGSSDGRLEYDFVVAPGASPDVSLDVEGADSLRIAGDGSLEVRVGQTVLRQLPPVVYQLVDGERRQLPGRYRLVGRKRIGFTVASYDRQRPLVIDPVLLYSTYLGGGGDETGMKIAVDGSGAAYVTGYTSSANFPAEGAFQTTKKGGDDAFVAKLSASGDALVYATYLGGGAADYPNDIAVDGTGAAYVTGQTNSSDFPTQGALQNTKQSGLDAFVTKLSPAGDALVYSTFLGGGAVDVSNGIAVDGTGAAFVTGMTSSTDFPIQGAFQSAKKAQEDAFVAKLSVAGDTLVYSTYLGGGYGDSGKAIAVDGSGAAYVVGGTGSGDFPTQGPFQDTPGSISDVFVSKLNPTGATLDYSTFLGGTGEDAATDIAVDGSGAAYISGYTTSTDFPSVGAFQSTHQGNFYDAFVSKLSPAGDALAYSTYLGGSGNEKGLGIAVDGSGAAYVTGDTSSTNFPTQAAFQNANQGGLDAFVTKLGPAGDTLVFSTYFGGAGEDGSYGIALDGRGIVAITGDTSGSRNLATANAYQNVAAPNYEAFVARIGDQPLSISPGVPTVPPRGSQAFTASGGSGAGYVFTLTSNLSGGSIDAATGAYTAGPTGGVTDVVRVTDSANDQTSISITVSAAVAITPATPSAAPLGTIDFAASGGSGSGYTWSLTSNNSGGVIEASTYTAGSTGNVSDTVQVIDSLGNEATVSVSIGASLTLDPAEPTVPPRGAQTFTATGGSGGYVFALTANGSGGSIDATTGAYVAGATPDTTDTVQVTDSNGATATVNVVVGGGLRITPPSAAATSGETIQFAVQGGSGTGYAWSLETNGSGATLSAAGHYVAGAVDGTDDVLVLDSFGNAARATVTVTATATVDGGDVPNPGDAGSADAGTDDAGSADAGPEDAGIADAGIADAGTVDAGTTDAGRTDEAGAPGGCGCAAGHTSAAPALVVLALLPWRRRARGSRRVPA